MSWKAWYFNKAKNPADRRAKDLFWDEIKPGCSKKQLATISKGVLDIDDPSVVDWRNVRTFHLYEMKDKISSRAVLSAISNMTRMASRGIIRQMPAWFKYHTGWCQRVKAKKSFAVTDEETFEEILKEVCFNQPEDFHLGVRAIFCLSYYCGFKSSHVGSLTREDMICVDGRVFLFKSGRLVELPEHVRLPVAEWLRIKKTYRKTKNPKMFKIEHVRALSKYPHLSETFTSLKRMRG